MPMLQVPLLSESTIAIFAMTFIFLLTNLLLITAAFAAPSGEIPIESRVARRRSQPLRRLETQTPTSNISHVVYSSNWAGAVWDTYPSVNDYSIIAKI